MADDPDLGENFAVVELKRRNVALGIYLPEIVAASGLLVRNIDFDEVEFPFEGLTLFASLEDEREVLSDPTVVRSDYLARLAAHEAALEGLVMFAIMLLPVSLAPFFFNISGKIFLVGAIILGIWFLWASIQAARSKTKEKAKKLLLVTVIYLPLLFILMVADKR